MCNTCGNESCKDCCHKGFWHGCSLSKISKILLIIGGLNWGLIGLGALVGSGMSWNLVYILLGAWPMLEAVIYLIVGLTALVTAFGCMCKTCKSGVCNSCMPNNTTSNEQKS